MYNPEYIWRRKSLEEIKALLSKGDEVFLTDGESNRVRLRPDGQLLLHWDGPDCSGESEVDYNVGRIDLNDPNTFKQLWALAEGYKGKWRGYQNLVYEESLAPAVFPAYRLEIDLCPDCGISTEVWWLGVEQYFVTRCPDCGEWSKSASQASEITDPAIKERIERNMAQIDKRDRDNLKRKLGRVARSTKGSPQNHEAPKGVNAPAHTLRDVDWSTLAATPVESDNCVDQCDSVEEVQVPS